MVLVIALVILALFLCGVALAIKALWWLATIAALVFLVGVLRGSGRW